MQALNRTSSVGICPGYIYSKDIYTLFSDCAVTMTVFARNKSNHLSLLLTEMRDLFMLTKRVLESKKTLFNYIQGIRSRLSCPLRAFLICQ